MTHRNLKQTKVTVVGLGLTGQACVRFLIAQGADVTGMDRNLNVSVPSPCTLSLGDIDQTVLCAMQLIVLSPGVDPQLPAIQAAIAGGVEVIGDIELFAWFNTKPVIAITGSNGKSTVTSLVAQLLNDAGIKALMGGNIGTPALDLLDADCQYIVLELSSFQLEMTHSLALECAVMLNISEDHLDRHRVFSAYSAAKHRIYMLANRKVFNRDDKHTWPNDDNQPPNIANAFSLATNSDSWGWDAETRTITHMGISVVSERDCALQGEHNMANIQAALCCLSPVAIDIESIKHTVSVFRGLRHRFELVSNAKGAEWINDSKATNVGAAIAAIRSVKKATGQKLVLIAGGDGKNADFAPLQNALLQDVDLLITFGKDGSKIAALKPGSVEVLDMAEAVGFAFNLVRQNDIVLLSPACASLDMFDNYQQRGDVFIDEIGRLETQELAS